MARDTRRTADEIAAIYEAVGDVERWRRLDQRLASCGLPSGVTSHLNAARQVHERELALSKDVEALKGTHARLSLAVLVVDAGGRMLAANGPARQILADGDALELVRGRVKPVAARHAAALRAAVEHRTGGAHDHASYSNPFLLVPRQGRPPLSLAVLSGGGRLHFFEKGPSAVILAFDPDRAPLPRAKVLRELFGLTAREAELAALLAQGKSVRDAATALGVRVNTARTFLARVAAKTDSHSQVELARALLAAPR